MGDDFGRHLYHSGLFDVLRPLWLQATGATLTELETDCTRQPDDSALWCTLGLKLAEQGEESLARLAFDTALDADPECLAAHLALGLMFVDRDEWPSAQRAFLAAAKLAPRSLGIHDWLGLIQEQMGEVRKAAVTYQKALSIDPQFTPARQRLATLNKRLPQPVLAAGEEQLDITVRAGAATHYRLGRGYLRQGRLHEARERFAAAVAEEPNSMKAQLGLAHASSQLGEYARAASAYEQVIRLAPDQADALLGAAVAHARAGNLFESQRTFHRLARHIAKEPTFVHRTAEAGLSRSLADVFQVACRNDVAQQPGADTDENLFDQEIQYLQTRVQQHPDRAVYHYNLGVLYHVQGDLPRAVQSLKRAISLNPRLPKPLLRLAKVYQQHGNPGAARECLEALRLWNLDYADVNHELGRLYEALGDDQTAAERYHQALDSNPHFSDALTALQQTRQRLGRSENAVRFNTA